MSGWEAVLEAGEGATVDLGAFTAAAHDAVRAGGAAELWPVGAFHEDARIRRAVVVLAGAVLDEDALELLEMALHEPADTVAIEAARQLCRTGDPAVARTVLAAAGRTARVDGRVPVARLDTRRALIVRLVVEAFPDLAPGAGTEERWDEEPWATDAGEEGDVIWVPAGGGVPGFAIDRDPVTVGRYLRSLRAVADDALPDLRHPDDPAGETEWPAAVDPDADLDAYPVVEVSWFDAWAFAARIGCELPSVAEWRRAVEHAGVDLTVAGDPAGASPLGRFLDERPAPGPVGVGAGPNDLVGNTWEWTRSRELDEHDIRPSIGRRLPAEAAADWRNWAIVAGRSWASGGATVWEVAKPVLELGPDVGFRCVRR